MSSKKKPKDSKPPELEAVEERVREMMEVKEALHQTDDDPAESSEAKSAPELLGESGKVEIEVSDEPAETAKVSIDKAIEEANQQLKTAKKVPITVSEEPEGEEQPEETPAAEAALPAGLEETETQQTSETPEGDQPQENEEETEKLPDEAPEAPTGLPEDLAGPEISEAVDDIVANESDELLAAEDDKLAEVFTGQKVTLFQRVKGFFTSWRENPLTRKASLAFLAVAVIAMATVPQSRYFALNAMGVRSSASLVVLDQSTQQPLKNVTVRLAGHNAQTDERGIVLFTDLKLGRSQLVIDRRAFATELRYITVGWGSNPLGEFALRPSGTQYAFKVSDFVSGKPIEKIEAVRREASAFSDSQGIIKLTLDKSDVDEDVLEIVLKGQGYREEKIFIGVNTKEEQPVRMVPGRKHVFISNRSGNYDVYKVDLDGKNEELALAGTGSERDDMVLATHPTDETAALVSKRDNKRNTDGFLLSTLTILDLKSNTKVEVAQSERVHLVGWDKQKIIYVQIAAGASATDPKRNRLMSYDYENHEIRELASANYFNDVAVIKGKIYYAPSSTYGSSGGAYLYSIESSGTNRQTILNKEVWSLLRPSYDRLILALQQEWYDYRLSSSTSPVKLEGEPAILTSINYVDSPNGRQSLWVDRRDGKGVLLSYNIESQKDTVLLAQSGLKYPIRWINAHTVVFRIKNDTQTADYVMSLNGGEPLKISDVTDTNSIDRWYYY